MEELPEYPVIFLVSGFWHGANWTFVAWGAYHALLFLPLLLLGQNRRYRDSVAENSFLPSVKELTQMGVTFLLVLLGWILFRSEDISQAAVYLERMFNASLFSAPQLVGLGFGQLLLKKCFFFHGSYVHCGMDRPKTSAWVDDRGPEPSGSVCYLYGIADYHLWFRRQ